MKAEAKGLKFLSMEGKVKIPFFQRTYVWSEENWEQLISELLRSENSSNFLGAIILKQIPTSSGEAKQLEVIDGQQRLTTLSILLKALYDTLPDDIKRNCEGDVLSIIRYRRDYSSDVNELRIEHSQVDQQAYNKVFNDSLDIDNINSNSHLILQCYKYFLNRFKEITDEDKKKLLNKLLNPDNKMLVVIDLNENDDEQIIFDTLNSAGVRLTAAEIIKNAIFKRAIELSNKEKAIELYNKTWKESFLKDEETVSYWETERTTGRLKRNNIEILLHCIGVIEDFFDPDKNSLSDLSKLYKQRLQQIKSFDEIKTFVEEIVNYANIYYDKIISFDKSYLLSFDNSITRLLHILEELEISTFHPFILSIFKKYQDENQVIEILFKLEKFVVLNMITKFESTKNYNKLCKQFIKDINLLDKKIEEILSNEKNIENGLKNLSNRNATLLLFWIELYRRSKDQNYDEKELKYDFTLEHIMPIKWEEHWNFNIVPHPDDELTYEEKKKERNEKIHWIGNMTLLKSRLNTSVSNNKFEIKINGDGRKKGIKHYASLSITKDDIVIPYENGNLKFWNENNIIKRTNNLFEEIKKMYYLN